MCNFIGVILFACIVVLRLIQDDRSCCDETLLFQLDSDRGSSPCCFSLVSSGPLLLLMLIKVLEASTR